MSTRTVTVPSVDRLPREDSTAFPPEAELNADLVDWRLGAACATAEAEIFYPPEGLDAGERRGREAAAKEICARCPVRVQCLLCAVLLRERHGIWGGTTADERLAPAGGPLLQHATA